MKTNEKKSKTQTFSAKKKVICILLCAVILFVISPFSDFVLSLGVMSVYSGMHERDSLLAKHGVTLDMPSGEGWYPFVMTFNPNEKLTILYNFPEFDFRWGKGCSRLYDPESPYYSAFYGAYVLEGNRVSAEAAAAVAKYDFQQLVLSDFGIKRSEMVFDWEETEPPHAERLLGEDGWTEFNAKLTVNGTAHEPDGFKRSYLQYGTPKYDLTGTQKPFAPLEQKGRVYAKYFEEADISIFFYVIAPEDEIIETCDEEILRQSRLLTGS